jgi:hypothetical protein
VFNTENRGGVHIKGVGDGVITYWLLGAHRASKKRSHLAAKSARSAVSSTGVTLRLYPTARVIMSSRDAIVASSTQRDTAFTIPEEGSVDASSSGLQRSTCASKSRLNAKVLGQISMHEPSTDDIGDSWSVDPSILSDRNAVEPYVADSVAASAFEERVCVLYASY